MDLYLEVRKTYCRNMANRRLSDFGTRSHRPASRGAVGGTPGEAGHGILPCARSRAGISPFSLFLLSVVTRLTTPETHTHDLPRAR